MNSAGAAAQNQRWVLGITGGIASGKSTVAAMFARRGVPVVDTDQLARDVVAPGTALLTQIFAEFGADLRQADGQLNRRALRARVFSEPQQRRRLEQLLHPAIRQRCAEWLQTAPGPYQIIVVPLLVEGKAVAHYNRVLVVDCDVAEQRQRLVARDGAGPAEIAAILAAQSTREVRLAAADDVIGNSGDLAALESQVENLHQRYLGMAHASSTIDG